MKAIFDTKKLEQEAFLKGLDEIILLENAGINLAKSIKKECKKRGFSKPKILFLLGGGNNAADGLVALRNLKRSKAYKLGFKENTLCQKQSKILENFGFKFLKQEPDFKNYNVIVDCIFGTGLNKELDEKTKQIIKKANSSKALKIACDIPTGLGFKLCFKADLTLCMGSLKELLLEDFAKNFVGKIRLAKLGISHKKFTPNAKSFLLEKNDLKQIKRNICSNKGNFGHTYICASASAGSLAGLGALNFGAGLVSLIADKSFSPLLMLKKDLGKDASSLAIGMGLEDLSILENEKLKTLPLVLDANCFLSKKILNFLNRKDVVITPHPKEFTRLYKLCFGKNLNLDNLQNNRFFYAKKFAKSFKCVLVLKGANTIIAQEDFCFVVNCGNENLAKAGSGDVLSGMIAALLGAKFCALKAACNAVLAHALSAKNYKFNKNSFDALKLIEGLKCL